ncbi:carbohydrate binding domain-containing protein [Paenibacillus solisilvae]|uniref:Carbohydrate binding domain-containing protein n=1 Tax=Paenibacillus solisilvae TaxID=2486751 RepID=A0ABW0VSB4_9BACL
MLYTTSKGKPGHLNVIDLADYKLLRSIPIGPSESSWAHTVAPDGTLYVAADGSGSRLWSYSPVTHTIQQAAQFDGESWPICVTTDDTGKAYVGTYPGGKVFQYDPATKQVKDYGRVIGSIPQEYVRSIAYQGGNVYAGTAHRQIVRVNLATGEKTDIAAGLNVPVTDDTVYDLDTIDNRYLFARYTDGTGVPGPGYIYDTATESWLDVVLDNVTGLHETDSLDGKIYYMSDKKLKTFDLATHEVALTGMEYGSGLRGADWAEFPDNPDLPGKNLVTVRYDGGVAIMNIATKTVHLYNSVIPGTPGVVNRIVSAPDGNLFVSGVQSSRGSVINPQDLSVTSFTIGQADSMYPLGDKMYMGVYPEGALYEYDMKAAPGADNPKRTFDLGQQQERLVNMTSGGGKLFIATIPTYGTLGGAMTVYDPASGGSELYRNIVQDQSVLSLAYLNGKVFGSTTINGGLGSLPAADEAKIFVWDSVTKQKITEFPLRINGLDKPAFIGDLSVGPDGLIWGASYDYIFAINPDTYEIVKSKKVQSGLSYSQWAHHSMRWSKDGLLYVLFNNKLTVIDPETLESRTITAASRFELGADGNLYVTDLATNTIMYRIEVDGEVKEPPVGIPVPVQNAGFEENGAGGVIPGWSPLFATGTDFTYALNGSRSFTGASSLNISDRNRNGSVALQSDKIPVTPGKNYTASVQLYIESGQPSFMFRFFDSNNLTLGTLEQHLDSSRLAQWQEVTLTGKAPENAAYGRLIAVTTRYNLADAYYDDFAVTAEDTAAPASTATIVPVPNEAGWLNRDAEIVIQATDVGGSGVAGVTYSASGAANLEPVTVSGAAASFTLSAEGVTTVTYSAEDRGFNKETPHQLEVKIDKTAPLLSFTGASSYTVDQTVTIQCQASDSVSGLAANPCGSALTDRPAYDFNPGSNSVSAQAADIAGNTGSQTFTFNVSVTYDSLSVLVKRFAAADPITATALSAEHMLAKKADEQGKEQVKRAILLVFDKEVAALSGKKFTQEQSAVLLKWSRLL